MENQNYSFEELAVWQKSRGISNVIFTMVKRFPKSETDRLADAMIKTSRSMGEAIAEGSGRGTSDEKIEFCYKARGSANKLIDQFITAFDCNYIEDITLKKNKNELNACIRLINEYINFLKNASGSESGLKEKILNK